MSPYPYLDHDADVDYDPLGPIPTGYDCKQISDGVQAFLRRLAIRARLTLVCESPIEIDLGAALIDLAGEQFTFEPQFKLARYRYDFVAKYRDRPICLIECDGADFHSTPEQLVNDAAKDQAALDAGLQIARATGREIYASPDRVALWLLNHLRRMI